MHREIDRGLPLASPWRHMSFVEPARQKGPWSSVASSSRGQKVCVLVRVNAVGVGTRNAGLEGAMPEVRSEKRQMSHELDHPGLARFVLPLLMVLASTA